MIRPPPEARRGPEETRCFEEAETVGPELGAVRHRRDARREQPGPGTRPRAVRRRRGGRCGQGPRDRPQEGGARRTPCRNSPGNPPMPELRRVHRPEGGDVRALRDRLRGRPGGPASGSITRRGGALEETDEGQREEARGEADEAQAVGSGECSDCAAVSVYGG